MYQVNNPNNRSWVEVADESDFSIQNLPFGVFEYEKYPARLCSAIGNFIIDLHEVKKAGYFDSVKELPNNIFLDDNLNNFIGLGKNITNQVRTELSKLLNVTNYPNGVEKSHLFLVPQSSVTMLLPIKIGDYTDFYSSREHATNVGTMFRDPANALLPNWLHIPVGYHGRASSVVVSETPITRPNGQMKIASSENPVFGPTKQLDFELEMAFVVGKNTALGQAIPIEKTEEFIFGVTLLNDWSARDIQAWEYVPLGPFLGKNFATTISPWIVTLEALEPFKVENPTQEPTPLPYLQTSNIGSYDIQLTVDIQTVSMEKSQTICRSNFKTMYWTMQQQLAHHTVNGCNVRVGDLCGSGTISGKTPDSYGSMLELAWKGTKPILLNDGSQRSFLQDGDTITLNGYAEKNGIRVGFGTVNGKIISK